MTTAEITVTLPRPHLAQARVLAEAGRFNVMACGRRFGKTLLGVERASRAALDGYPVGWFAPSYKDSGEAWRQLVRTLGPVIASKSETEKRLELVTGGLIEVWTMKDPHSSGRSRKYKLAIIDEAAKVPKLEIAWTESIRPTLSDYRGGAWFLSTPKGRNYFWRLFNMATQYDNWRAWQMPTAANPFIHPDEIEDARQQLPQSAFAQEYLAEFTDDAGAVFRNVRGCVDDSLPLAEPQPDRRYYGGLDWAQMADFTVIAVVDDTGALVALDRFNQVAWAIQYGRVKAMTDRWGIVTGYAELNSIGSPNLEQLQAQRLSQWRGFTTTNDTKAEIIQALALAFERGEIRIPNDPVLIAELESFEANRLPSGKWRYSAPDGMHDDTVIALALAWHGATAQTAHVLRIPHTGLYRGADTRRRVKVGPRS